MKIKFKIAVVLLASVVSAPAHAYVYFTRDALLTSFFPGQAWAVETFAPDPAALRAVLGYPLPQAAYDIVIAARTDGTAAYAIIDDQLGLHEPITFAVLLDAHAHVERLEVMVYREAYGDGVRALTFTRQFHGLGVAAPMRPGKDIRIVSGATVSTRSLAVGTRRACAIVEAWLAR